MKKNYDLCYSCSALDLVNIRSFLRDAWLRAVKYDDSESLESVDKFIDYLESLT